MERYRCDDETIAGLRLLRRSGYKLGIATNGGARQLDKIAAWRPWVESGFQPTMVAETAFDVVLLILAADGVTSSPAGAIGGG